MRWPWSRPIEPPEKAPARPDTPVFNVGNVVRKRIRQSETGMIVGVMDRLGGGIEYYVSWVDGVEEQKHYAEELILDAGFDC